MTRPDVRVLLDHLAAYGGPGVEERTPEAARAAMLAALPEADLPPGDLATVRELSVPAAHGTIPALLLDPRESRTAGPVVLWYHGGGFVTGGIETHRSFASEVARLLDLPVVLVGYRLAPEAPYPPPPTTPRPPPAGSRRARPRSAGRWTPWCWAATAPGHPDDRHGDGAARRAHARTGAGPNHHLPGDRPHPRLPLAAGVRRGPPPHRGGPGLVPPALPARRHRRAGLAPARGPRRPAARRGADRGPGPGPRRGPGVRGGAGDRGRADDLPGGGGHHPRVRAPAARAPSARRDIADALAALRATLDANRRPTA
ncbi:alpha/beta hydrolase fold domain-containing protein [Streptomyces sp. M19]